MEFHKHVLAAAMLAASASGQEVNLRECFSFCCQGKKSVVTLHTVVIGGLLSLVVLLSSAGHPEVFVPGLMLIMTEGCKQTAKGFTIAVPYG